VPRCAVHSALDAIAARPVDTHPLSPDTAHNSLGA
jgi:hypothetical protein